MHRRCLDFPKSPGRGCLPPSYHWLHTSCLPPMLDWADWSQPIVAFFGKIGQVVWWKNKNDQNGAALSAQHMSNWSVWNEGTQLWRGKEGFLVTCHGLGHYMPMMRSYSHHASDACVFWLILQWEHTRWWSLRYGFPCFANTLLPMTAKLQLQPGILVPQDFSS